MPRWHQGPDCDRIPGVIEDLVSLNRPQVQGQEIEDIVWGIGHQWFENSESNFMNNLIRYVKEMNCMSESYKSLQTHDHSLLADFTNQICMCLW